MKEVSNDNDNDNTKDTSGRCGQNECNIVPLLQNTRKGWDPNDKHGDSIDNPEHLYFLLGISRRRSAPHHAAT